MKKLTILATALCLLFSSFVALPTSASGIDDHLVAHWDFAGDDPLADKATAGSVNDTLFLAETDSLKIEIKDGIATIPAGSGSTFLYAMPSEDLLASQTMTERTIFFAVKFTGALDAGNIELMSQNGGGRIVVSNDTKIKGSITQADSLGTDPFWPVEQALSADTMLYIALTFKYNPANGDTSAGYQMASYLSTDGGKTYTAKTANGGVSKMWGTLAVGKNMTTLSLGRNVSLHGIADTTNNVEVPMLGGGHTGTVISFEDVRIYDKALTADEVKSIVVTNPTATPTPPADTDNGEGEGDADNTETGDLTVAMVATVVGAVSAVAVMKKRSH